VLAMRRIEKGCLGLGLLCAFFCLCCALEATGIDTPAAEPRSVAPAMTQSGTALGRIEIPAIGLSVPVVEDDDTRSLLQGLGHIRGTATLGGLGTTALAGHRDTFLRPVRHIALNMEIMATNQAGTYRYIVDSTEIVDPEQVHVLDIQDRPELVLITCYPFDYIGAAPRRFIVHAHLVSADPEPIAPKVSH
jgi:sortase A